MSSSASPLAFIALGSNLGNPIATVSEAMVRLEGLSRAPLATSSLWRSAPVDCPPDSPPFVNAVVGLAPRPDETPESLLRALQALERELGRAPKRVHNEARVVDLDLIAFGGLERRTAELTLPHPRAHLRGFVLRPLSELAPDLVLPGQTQTVTELAAALGPDETLSRID